MTRGIGLAFLPYHLVASHIKHQEQVLKIITILPGKYRYEQVEAAIRASGASSDAIYWLLAANDRTEVLARFYEALHGQG